MLHVLDIIAGTSVDGPGLRTSIYLAGCNHRCPGCHNPQSWDFNGGRVMSIGEIMEVVREEDFNVTISGGDPLCNSQKILPLLQALKKEGYNVWLYTGFCWEYMINDEHIRKCLMYIDVLIDGKYIEQLRDTSLRFRGSSNQRIISVSESLHLGKAVILPY